MDSDFWKDKYPIGIAHTIEPSCYNNILEIFAMACQKFAEQPAFTNSNHTITYQQLDALSMQLASYLQQLSGLQKGDRIAIQMPNLLQYPVVVFAIIRAGFVVVNTNPLYTAREMLYQFNDAGVKCIICLSAISPKLESIIAKTAIQHVILTELDDLHCSSLQQINHYSVANSIHLTEAFILGQSLAFKQLSIQPDDIAVLQYTGGTTGIVKGAILTQRNLTANTLQCKVLLERTLAVGKEIVIAPLPMYHVYAFTINCMALLMLGVNNILITNPRDTAKVVQEIAKIPFTVFIGVNTLFVALSNDSQFKHLDFSHLKLTISGGMALQPTTNTAWKEITNTDICEGYGLTEASPVVSFNYVENIQQGSIGMPVASTLCKVIDDNENELPIGEYGELCIKGPQIMQGYWNHPEETAKVFTADGWLKTGDIALIQADGYIRIIDRKKDIILVSGFNVYPNELENVLAELSGITMAAAIGVPDPNSGEAIKLFIVLKEGVILTESEIMTYLHENLASYKCPKYLEFREQLPVTNVGKVLRKQLREQELKNYH
ncbi:AMP-binding protein [Entomomonas asaccharolytica]|uniref:Long-chain-fatty-acid--CoA ligase n=1 Tax=Entomomonas asaccharolytica TaxID=2785331 RepID=A0A974RYC0_9GAMM|nr:AMP-binding protein [Entomomonas asaccharolytica]QQP87052.1 AMP-binding protein [Entomomonas asaccharolytica]